MDLKVHGDTIESLIKERRETEKEAKSLQEQIDRLRKEREMAAPDNPDTLTALDEQLQKLTQEKSDRAHKLKNICMMARTISAGD